MAYIKVDHSKFEGAASAIDDYVSLMRNKMGSAQGDIKTLAYSWQGSDFNQFKFEFDKLDNNNSVHSQMIKAMQSYSKYLRFAASKYKEAQINAINRANRLPRY